MWMSDERHCAVAIEMAGEAVVSAARTRTESSVRNAGAAPVEKLHNGRRALLVDGVVQSVHPDDAASGYWNRMLPDYRPATALLLGMGGGTVARLLVRAFSTVEITGVDDSAEMLKTAAAFGPPLERVRLIEADAFAFIHRDASQYDFIAVDLFRGGDHARGTLALPFLRTLAARLTPGGGVAYNLFRDELLGARLTKLERVFERLRLDEVGENAVFHGRARPRQR